MNSNENDSFNEGKYTERDIDVNLSDVSSIHIVEKPIGNSSSDKQRYDKGVTLSSMGVNKRTSSIMTGYTKIKLEDGSYVSESELLTAISRGLELDAENEFVVSRKTGKKVNPSDIGEAIVTAVKKSGTLTLEDSNVISNQETKKVFVKEQGQAQSKPKGIFMLGNGQIQMPNGEYISVGEVEKAIKDYVILSPVEETKPKVEEPGYVSQFVNPTTSEKEMHKFVKTVSAKVKPWAAAISAAVILSLGFGKVSGTEKISTTTIQNNLEYTVSSMSEVDVFEDYGEVLNRIYREVEINDKISVEPGVKYYNSSDYAYVKKPVYGTFEKNPLRPAGEYNVDYISVLNDGRIKYVETQDGKSVLDALENVSNKYGVDISNLEAVIHLGGPVSGWVQLKDLISEEQLTPQKLSTKVVLDKEYTGNIDDFSGNTIDIQTKEGSVKLPVKDQSGNLLADGSAVMGSDGQEYRISSLKLEETEVISEVEERTEPRVVYNLHNIADERALAAGLIAATAPLMTLLTAKKKEKEQEVTEQEYTELLDKYSKNFDKDSAFVRAVNAVHGRKPDWERINISFTGAEAISEMYSKQEGGVKK